MGLYYADLVIFFDGPGLVSARRVRIGRRYVIYYGGRLHSLYVSDLVLRRFGRPSNWGEVRAVFGFVGGWGYTIFGYLRPSSSTNGGILYASEFLLRWGLGMFYYAILIGGSVYYHGGQCFAENVLSYGVNSSGVNGRRFFWSSDFLVVATSGLNGDF